MIVAGRKLKSNTFNKERRGENVEHVNVFNAGTSAKIILKKQRHSLESSKYGS